MYASVLACVRYDLELSIFLQLHVGLKQSNPSSPLICMMYVNDLLNNISSDLEEIFTLNELKLFLILYADDQVVFAKSATALQSMLNDSETCCKLWKLRINTFKNQSDDLRKGTSHSLHVLSLQYKHRNSHMLQYLGLTFYKNGSWFRTQKDVARRASISVQFI